jgi:hypothetical protein
VQPGQQLDLALTVELPLRQLIEDPPGNVQEAVVPLFGDVDVYLTVGFTKTPFRLTSADPLSDLIRRQALTAPAMTTITIQ